VPELPSVPITLEGSSVPARNAYVPQEDLSWTKLRFCNDSEHLNFKKNSFRPEEA